MEDDAVIPNVPVMAVCPEVRRAHVELDISDVDDAAVDGYTRVPEVRAGTPPSQAGMEDADGRTIDGHQRLFREALSGPQLRQDGLRRESS